jgi:MoxR-like ATPase
MKQKQPKNQNLSAIESKLDQYQKDRYFEKQEDGIDNTDIANLLEELKDIGVDVGTYIPEASPKTSSELNHDDVIIASARFRNMYDSYKKYVKLQKLSAKIQLQLFDLKQKIHTENEPTKFAKQIATLEQAFSQITISMNTAIDQNPELYFAYHLRQIKTYKEQASRGEIIQSPYVIAQKRAILDALQNNQNIFIHGSYGTGKTDIALLASKEYISQVHGIDSHESAKVISGHKDLESFEMFGQPSLGTDEYGNTASLFQLGAAYEAPKAGLPLIIDEANAIPHAMLIRLNYILEQGKKPGSTIHLQEDNGKEIITQKGFAAIATGNLPDETGVNSIIGRQDIDAAFLSRFSKKIEQDFLPQSTEAKREDGVLERTGNELFEILMSRIVDKHGYMQVHAHAIDDLWKLCAFARLVQESYSGKSDAKVNIEGQDINLNELIGGYSISWRELNGYMQDWIASGCTRKLGAIVQKFINEIPNNTAKLALTTLMASKYDLDVSAGSYNTNEIQKYGPREVIELIYGPAPDRTRGQLALYTVKSTQAIYEEPALVQVQTIDKESQEILRQIEEMQREFQSAIADADTLLREDT